MTFHRTSRIALLFAIAFALLAVNQLRPQLVTIPGVAIPFPYGGKQRQIMVASQQALSPEVRGALTGSFPFAGADCAALTERDLLR